MNRNEDMADDLELDCAIHDPPHVPAMDPTIKERLMKFDKHRECSQQDSGVYSFDSVVSFKSSDIGKDEVDGFVENCVSMNDDLPERIGQMQITETEIEESVPTKASMVLCEDDEGYHSKSLTCKPWESGSGIQEGQLVYGLVPSEEAVEAYSQDDDGDTQLHIGIIQLAEEISLQFINMAPKYDWLNMVNLMLQTPLHLAVITCQCRIVRRLMVAGATVDVRDLLGNTPLHIAAREGYTECVQNLLEPILYTETLENKYEIPYQRLPQDLEVKNYDGHTPLQLAAQGTHIETMKCLLKKRANINAQDGKSGRTVLHYAAETGNRKLLEFLLSCEDIDLNCCTYGGLTPVILAAGRGFGDVVEILQSHGADCSSLQEDADEEEMIDDFCLAGQPLLNT